MRMTKNKLMIAAAVAALTAGSTLAFAQSGPQSQSNPASRSAPAEKMAPSSKSGGEHAQTQGGQRGEERGSAQNHMQGQGQMNERAQDRNNKSRSETTGQAPNQAAPQANPKEKSKGNAEQKRFENNAQQRGERNERNRSTTGQGAPENRGGAMQQNRTNEGRSGTSTTVEGRDKGAGSVNLTTEQRTKIHSTIIAERSAPRIEHADFDVRVGTVVPRGKVKFAPLPSSIVEIEPVWRGFEYFLVGDEIVVVNPNTLHIVAVIPA